VPVAQLGPPPLAVLANVDKFNELVIDTANILGLPLFGLGAVIFAEVEVELVLPVEIPAPPLI
jgi:hypothetical protein